MYSSLVNAQQFIRLDSILIQGGRLPSSVFNEGKQISILTEQDIQAIPASSLDELLSQVTGVHITTRSNFGAQADIGIRGSTYAQVLVLIDGQRMNDPLTGHFNSNLSIPIQQISRIEIIRGPASASYGSDAMGGVIAISTKTYVNYIRKNTHLKSTHLRAEDNTTNSYTESDEHRSYHSNAAVKVGSHGSLGQYIDINSTSQRWIIEGYALNTKVEGENRINPNAGIIDGAPANYMNFYNQQSAGISSVIKWTNTWTQYVRLGYDQRDFNAKYFYTISPYDESTEDVQRRWLQFSSKKTFSSSHIEIDGMIQATTDIFDFNPLFIPNEHTTTQTQAHLNWVGGNKDKNLHYTLGMQLLQKKIASTDRGNHSNLGYGFYGIIRSSYYRNKSFLRSIHITSSMRADYHDTYKLEWIPQLSVNLITRLGVFQSSAGKSIRSADFTELYVSHNLPSISSGRNVGNPALEAEESWSIDLNFKSNTYSKLRYEVGTYYRNSKKLIDYIYTPANQITQRVNIDPDGFYFYPQNISQGRTFGLEQTLVMRLGQADDFNKTTERTNPLMNEGLRATLEVILGHSYINTTIDAATVSKYLLEHPKHQWNAQMRLNNETTILQIGIRHLILSTDSDENMGFKIDSPQNWVDIKTSKNFSLPNWSASPYSRIEWSLEVRNSLDKSYQQILGATLPGRWILAGIRLY